MNIVSIIVIASHLPVLAAAIGYLWAYPGLNRTLRVFSWFVFLSAFVQLISLILFLFSINNMPLLHLYVAGGLSLLVLFYKGILGDYIDGRLLWGVIGCFLVFTIVNTLFFQPINRFNSNALVVESLLIITLSLFTFLFFLNDTVKETEIADKESLNWINSGLFIYFLSCVLIYYFGDLLLFHFPRSVSGLTWMFHSFFSMIMYSCFLMAVWKRSRTSRI